jgi:hypothetical protein
VDAHVQSTVNMRKARQIGITPRSGPQ